MKCNVGKTDRILRIIAGIAMISWGAATSNIWGGIVIVPLLTGMIRWSGL